ncbi:MAG: hypothetical protein JWQ43_273 [Glaciihabitans sp.]|nr:hypothetical protein [Glaciihabitans sp.]
MASHEFDIPSAGWRDDGHGQLRWWNGQDWTEHTKVAAAPGVATGVPPAQKATGATSKPVVAGVTRAAAGPRTATWSTWVVGIVVVLGLVLFAVVSGFVGLLVGLGFAIIPTGLYVLVTGRGSWARMPKSRKIGALLVAVGLVALLLTPFFASESDLALAALSADARVQQ